MKSLAILSIVSFVFTGCSSWEQYDSVRLQAGVQIPIPGYEVNVGFNLDMKDKSVLEKELQRKVKYIDAYADFEAWQRRRKDEISSD